MRNKDIKKIENEYRWTFEKNMRRKLPVKVYMLCVVPL